MDPLLVISEEFALFETLASELPDVPVEHASFQAAAAKLKDESHRLVIIDADEKAGADIDTGAVPAIRLKRPVRLAELLYTIAERLQGKTMPGREELALSEGLRFSAQERVIRSHDGSGQIPLTEKEAELLMCLLQARRQTVSRDMLLKSIWGYSDDIATHTLETHIYRLRGKLRQASESLDILSSEEGGYRLSTGQ